METCCISAPVGINHLFPFRTGLPQCSSQALFPSDPLKSTCPSKLQITNQSPCPRRLKNTDCKSIYYTFGWRWYLQDALSKGISFFFRKEKKQFLTSKIETCLQMYLTFLWSHVFLLFPCLLHALFLTLPFSASFLCSLMRSIDLRG